MKSMDRLSRLQSPHSCYTKKYMKPIYLDYAAATPVDNAAIRAAEPFLIDSFYNPSAVYQASREVKKHLESARTQVAHILGARSKEIIFTAGGSEANNIAICGVMAMYPDAHCIVSAIEHESVLEPALQYLHTISPVSEDGIIAVESVINAITDNTVIVSIMYANNEIGTIQPLKDIVAAVQLIRKQRRLTGNSMPLYVHTDACQAANYLDIQVQRIGVDMMTLNGGKIYSYKQSGCLYVRTGVELQPLVYGGGQERSIRSGTENVPSIMAFATMLQKVQKRRKSEITRLQQIHNIFIATISQKLTYTTNGSIKKRLPNNLNLTFPGSDGERLLMELDEAGIMVATGSACTASNDQPSHVLKAIGLSDNDAQASLRVTFGAPTTLEGTKTAAEVFCAVVSKHVQLV